MGKAGWEKGDKGRVGVEEEKEHIEQEGKERCSGNSGVDDRKDMNSGGCTGDDVGEQVGNRKEEEGEAV